MRGVAFPKAKYGAIAAIIIIVVVNVIYYKDFFISLMALVGTNFDLKTPNRSTKLIKKYFIFFFLAILNKFFDIN